MRLSLLLGQTQRRVGRYPPEDGRHWLLRAAYLYESDHTRLWLPLGVALRERLWRELAAAWQEDAVAQRVAWPVAAGESLPPEVAALLEAHVGSYRQLPRLLWQQQGDRLEAWLLAETPEAARERAAAIHDQWERLLAAMGLRVVRGEGAPSAVTFAPAPGGETVLTCPRCGYMAAAAWARRAKPTPAQEPLQPLTPVATPHADTIRSLADFLGVPESRTAKAVFWRTREDVPRVVFAVVRGEMQVSEAKVARLLGVAGLEAASPEDIRAVGAEPGYASPVGVQGAVVVVDDAIPHSPNLVAGANRAGYHLTGVNYGRDFQADWVADIAAAQVGDPCPQCGAPLQAETAWAVVARWEPRHTLSYLTSAGKPAPLGVAVVQAEGYALLAALAAAFRSGDGLAWPPAVAPYAVHLIALRGGETEAEALYRRLQAAGVSVLYDDRKASPGVKFTDADLIGLPWRVTVSKRSLQRGGAEVRARDGAAEILPLEAVVAHLIRP